MIKNPTSIEGLVAWIETDLDGNIVDKLGELGIKRSAVFVWTDPNNPSRGCQLVFSRPLSDEESNQVNEWLVEHFNPPLTDLPR